MPIYQITGKNGVVYRVNGPEGLSKEQVVADVLSKYPEAGVPKQEENLLEKVPLVGGALAGAADIPLSLIEGFAGTGKTFTDVFGADNAASRFLGDVAEGAGEWKSSGSREDALLAAQIQKQAEGKGTWEEVKAAGRAFAQSPLETTASVIGSAIPFIAAGLAAPETGGTSLLPIAAMAGMGAVSGTGMIKGDIYDAVYKASIEHGATEAEAKAAAEKAQEYGGENLDQIALGSVFGAAAAATGFAPSIAKAIGRKAAQEVVETTARKSVLKGAAKGAVEEAIPEAAQAAQERYAQNVALQREGFAVDPYAGVAGQAAFEGIASIIPGMAGGRAKTIAENRKATARVIEEEFNALPENPDPETLDKVASRFVARGIPEDVAQRVVTKIAAEKAALKEQAEQREAMRKAAIEQRTEGITPSPEPDINAPMPSMADELAPPPADPEEEAARQRFYGGEEEQQVSEGPILYHGGRRGMTADDIQIIREPGATKQGKKGRVYGGFYTTPNQEEALGYANMVDGDNTVYRVGLKPDAVIGHKEGDITRLSPEQISEYRARGVDVLVGKDIRGRTEHVIINRDAVQSLQDINTPAQQTRSPNQPMTPEQAASTLDSDAAIQAFADQLGIDQEEAMNRLQEWSGIRYSRRGRPPKTTADEGLFGALPTQEQNRLDKREELTQLQLSTTPEERVAQQQEQLADTQERLTEKAARDEEARAETLGDIEYALRAQAPENAPYKVVYDPEDAKAPYKLVAERTLGEAKPEVIIAAPTLQDFSDAVYGQMEELTPYIPPAELSGQTVERADSTEPTVATSMIQQFTQEVDAAREAGQIDNNQRAQLLGRLERPNAYVTMPNGTVKPNDAIAKLEAEATKAMEAFRNAENVEERTAAEQQLNEVNGRLTAAVKNSLLNPIRATLKSMVETRSDERLGASVREENAKLQEKLGAMEGADTTAERTEAREAAIDKKETKVQKFRQKAASGRMLAKDVQAVVDRITSRWKSKVPVKVVQSVSEIDDPRLRAAVLMDDAADANGFIAPSGTIYLIADNIGSTSEATAVLYHEALGHLGLERLFRGELDKTLTTLYRSNAQLRTDTDKWMAENPDAYAADSNPLARAVEEVLAERSEGGRIKQSLLQRIAAVIRDFARRMGIDLAFSNNDVMAVLARAHALATDQATDVTLKGIRYTSEGPNVSEETAEELSDMEADISEGLRRTQKSVTSNGVASGIGEAIKARDFDAILQGFKDNYEGMSPAALKATLRSFPTSGILNWFKNDIPSLAEIDQLVSRMSNMKMNIIKAADPIAKELDEFMLRDKGQLLAQTMSTSRINSYAPDSFKTLDEALQNEAVLKEVESRILRNANDVKLAQKLIDDIKALAVARKSMVAAKGDKTKPSPALRALTNQLYKDAKDNSKVSQQVKQLVERTGHIRDGHMLWDNLAKVSGGHKLYKEIRAFYKDMFEAELALLDARIESLVDDTQAKRLRDLRADMMRTVASPEEAKKRGDTFYDIPGELFTKDYFPFMRQGNYYLVVKGAKDGTREREFYQFDSAKERNRALAAVAKRLGVSKDDGDVFAWGNDISEMQKDLASEDLMMQQVGDLVGKTKAKMETEGIIGSRDVNDLVDSIYQTWLMSTPERSVRRRFLHAEEVVGFQQDILRQFSSQVTSYANQLSKMAFASDIRTKVGQARDSLEGRPPADKAKLNTVINEMAERSEQEINPDPQSAIINVMNRASYFYYLTSVATALINLTSIPIRVLPRMWRDYGFGNAAATYTKYMNLYKTLGNTRVEPVVGGRVDQLQAIIPDLRGSKYINAQTPRGELLRRAMKAGNELNVLETITDTLIQNEREVAKKHREGVTRTAAEVAAGTAKVMGVAFNAMENISRQAAYFMNFELAYDSFKAKNPQASEDEAFDHAVSKAVSAVRDTLGDYSNWERPRIAKNNLTRALFLFKMYPIIQTKFLVGAVRDIVRNQEPGVRAGALKELTGVTLMAGVFGGLAGMPLYSLLALALSQSFDDDDDEDVKKLMGLDVKVAYDSDIMFQMWMAEKFGSPTIGGVPLSDVLVHGAVGALTDTELSSRVSLDLKNMWFREAVAGDSWSSTALKTALANIAGGQMAISLIDGGQAMYEGDIYAGLKKMLPAFFRSFVTAAQGEEEGATTRRGDIIIKPEDITAMDTMRSILGFRSLRLSRLQDYAITRAKNEKRINSERQSIFNEFNKKRMEGDFESMEDFREFWKERILPFNRTYPDPDFVITMESLMRSAKGREEVAGRTVQGMQLSKKTAQRDLKMAEPFLIK